MAALGVVSPAEAGGFELGARLGYGIPMGKAVDATDGELSKTIKGMVPLQLDVGYRVIPNLTLGGYVMYGFGLLGDEISSSCDQSKALGIDVSCGVSDLRLGIQGQFHIMPTQDVDPWVGVGLGYEWLSFSSEVSSGGRSQEVTLKAKGMEFLSLQGGADFNVAPGLGLGPFLSFSLGQYSSTSDSCSGECAGFTNESEDIANKALHQWLLLGVRGTFVIGGSN